MGGRALTLYERVHPESELNTQKAHQSFLDALALILPEGCQPIIVTDAIYRTPWFNAVEQKFWYWIGRVRGRVCLSLAGHDRERSETAQGARGFHRRVCGPSACAGGTGGKNIGVGRH